MQHSLKSIVTFQGIGLHSGADVLMAIYPAAADHGILFVRTDVTDRDNTIPALWDHVVDTRMCSVLGNEAGVTVGTVEHIMAALRGCGVDNAVIELDGPEVPIMDGSSARFVEKMDEAGFQVQSAPRRAIKVLKEIIVEQDGKRAVLRPGQGSSFSAEIDFDHPSIGSQSRDIRLVNGNFRHDLADSRTFGFLHEVEALRRSGLALGGSLDNAIVLDDDGVINENGLRHEDEFIRHKLLDAVGDLYLAGGRILGAYESGKPGHALNNALLRKLFETDGAWVAVDLFIEEQEAPGGYHTAGGRPATVVVA